jgi:hypothetical protein
MKTKFSVFALACCSLSFPPVRGDSTSSNPSSSPAAARAAVFTQTVIAKSGRKPQKSPASFALQRPGKFRWSYDKPYKQLLVSDGSKLWSYDPDLNQVSVKKLGTAFGPARPPCWPATGSGKAFRTQGRRQRRWHRIRRGPAEGGDASFDRVRIGFFRQSAGEHGNPRQLRPDHAPALHAVRVESGAAGKPVPLHGTGRSRCCRRLTCFPRRPACAPGRADAAAHAGRGDRAEASARPKASPCVWPLNRARRIR